MAFPAHLFDHCKKQPLLFLCKLGVKEILLFGTYHAISLSTLPEHYKEILNRAKTLCVEIIQTDISEESLITADYFFKEAQTKGFDEKLSTESREILENALKQLFENVAVKPIPFDRVNLKFADLLCSNVTTFNGIDDELMQFFKKSNKKIVGLEDKASRQSWHCPETSIEELNDILPSRFGCFKKNPEHHPTLISEIEEYFDGSDLFNANACYEPETAVDSLGFRNRAWIPKILEHLQEQNNTPILVAVGSHHFAGTAGLPYLLHKAGFKVSQYLLEKDGSFRFLDFRPDILFDCLLEIQTIIKEKIDSNYELTLEYYGVPTILFSKVYPHSKLESEAEMTHLNDKKENYGSPLK